MVTMAAFLASSGQNKKTEKDSLARIQFEKATAAIDSKGFVVVVDTYELADGNIATNTDVTVFLSQEQDFVFLQGPIVAGNTYTNKLTIASYDKVVDKKGNLRVEMQARGTFITARIEVFLKKGGNYADVIITPTKGETRRFSGELVPVGESDYFKRPGEV